MLQFLSDFCDRPAPFSRSTVKDLWTRPHLSEQMLNFHLSQDTVLASRPREVIEHSATWIHAQLDLQGKKLCDLGCGPGLYAEYFCAHGAAVTGIDFSPRSIQYATNHAPRDARFIEADYVVDDLPTGFDIVTLIYTDYCVLAPQQRARVLSNVAGMLNEGGYFVFDVVGVGQMAAKQEETLVERNLMNGFWASAPYVGMHKSFLYPEANISLDRYAIIERAEHWEIFNWYQYFSTQTIADELKRHGFEVVDMAGDLTGAPLGDADELFAIVAQPIFNNGSNNAVV